MPPAGQACTVQREAVWNLLWGAQAAPDRRLERHRPACGESSATGMLHHLQGRHAQLSKRLRAVTHLSPHGRHLESSLQQRLCHGVFTNLLNRTECEVPDVPDVVHMWAQKMQSEACLLGDSTAVAVVPA